MKPVVLRRWRLIDPVVRSCMRQYASHSRFCPDSAPPSREEWLALADRRLRERLADCRAGRGKEGGEPVRGRVEPLHPSRELVARGVEAAGGDVLPWPCVADLAIERGDLVPEGAQCMVETEARERLVKA